VLTSDLTIKPLSTAVGSEIHGIDISRPVDDATIALIRKTFNERGVIFFRDQHVDSDQFIAFARRFGELTSSKFNPKVDGYTELAEVRKEEQDTANIGGGWHTDQSFRDVPVMGTMLIARTLPSVGGDTMWLNMSVAYEALSDGLKETLSGLRAVHSNAHVFGVKAAPAERSKRNNMVNLNTANDEATHPVVGRHPETGRQVLYVNQTYTLRFAGWTEKESEPLLRFLYAHVARPEYTCRFHWEEGSVAFWDNRTCLHYALNDYHGEQRLMHRLMVAGPPLQ
jgi:taurine dioxygenase